MHVNREVTIATIAYNNHERITFILDTRKESME